MTFKTDMKTLMKVGDDIEIAYAIYAECVRRSNFSAGKTRKLLALLERDRQHEHKLQETEGYERESTWANANDAQYGNGLESVIEDFTPYFYHDYFDLGA